MRFLVDECTGPVVAQWLRSEGHEVFSVYDEAQGVSDEEIINKAFVENWILISNDKDFGDKVFRERYPHHGIILLRLNDERTKNKTDVLRKLLEAHSAQLSDHFVVVSESQARFAGR